MDNVVTLTLQWVVVVPQVDALPLVFGPFPTLKEAEAWELSPMVDEGEGEAAVVGLYQPAIWAEL